VSKSGYNISGSPKQAQVYYYSASNISANFSGLSADGSATVNTTKLTLTFDKDIAGLVAADISLTPNNTGATKGALTKLGGTGMYELALTGISAGGQVSVAVSKSGYNISGSPKQAQVYYFSASNISANFSGLSADGSSTATTTKLTLTFDKDIAGLSAGDISLTPNNTGAAKGTLTKLGGTGVYELALSGITQSGEITVAVSKSGYNISGSPKQVQVHFKTESNINIGIGDPTITLYLDSSPLQEGGVTPITLSPGGGTFTVSIASGTYTSIVWHVNGSVVAQGASRTSYTLPKRTAGTYLVTVEATPADGEKNTGSHNFVVE
jgi:hypothetical protein